ncbi:MAG: MarR family transcriptional regulator [Alphaproteobacteria bacterium]
MTTRGQKACYVIDHLVEALGNDPSSSIRRALILTDIHQYAGTTQTGVMERLQIHKSALTREIEWLFNYGCIVRSEADNDGRAVKLHVYGYSKTSLETALDYCGGSHENLKYFLNGTSKALRQEKPTLRDAKIMAIIYDRKTATKQDVIDSLYKGSASTDNRAINELVEDGVLGSE